MGISPVQPRGFSTSDDSEYLRQLLNSQENKLISLFVPNSDDNEFAEAHIEVGNFDLATYAANGTNQTTLNFYPSSLDSVHWMMNVFEMNIINGTESTKLAGRSYPLKIRTTEKDMLLMSDDLSRFTGAMETYGVILTTDRQFECDDELLAKLPEFEFVLA